MPLYSLEVTHAFLKNSHATHWRTAQLRYRFGNSRRYKSHLVNMGALVQKLFGPGATPLLEVDTTGACASECCDQEVEIVSSSSSEPHTHESAHAATESYNTVPPEIQNPCSSGTSVVGRKVYQMSGEKLGTRL